MTEFLGSQTLTVERTTGSVVDGVWTQNVTTSFDIAGSVQPVIGRELQSLPEGQRTRARYKLFTESDLIVIDSASGTEPDRVQYLEKSWQVQEDENWNGHTTGLPHRKYFLIEPGDDSL